MTTKEDYESWAAGLVIHAREEAMAEGEAKGLEKGAADERTAVALDMLADDEPLEKIVKYSHLPMEKVLELKESQVEFTAK